MTLRAFRQRAAVYATDDPLKPPAGDIVVDGLGINALGPQPRRIDHEARWDFVQQWFQSRCSLRAHNHLISIILKTNPRDLFFCGECIDMAHNHANIII